ncbi:phosphoglycerate dehydrogenase-like enzyme [Stackebrandtia endophytica]|uniref:Phosphoglycerate dehydrogenase-like enzyme n=1 Tax=Stackebrandtia endophytica TaxID=1496996 RepID=A0A543ARQ2_9ACTN|nr:2-hydroxyacid dehydrogenase [Stackebrandtia endophytica]TQL75260.1 phosphoglycerate dehydrogenase-like enzyme [Stackebrandtia endophytica]
MKVWISHKAGLELIGDVPSEVTVEVFEPGGEYPSDPATVEFWVPTYLGKSSATRPLAEMTGLKVVQLLTAGAEVWIPVIPEGVVLCDAKGAHTGSTSEWALTAMLASLRKFPAHIRAQAQSRWAHEPGRTLAGKTVLIVGAGDIGTSIARKVEAFDAEPVLVARRERPGVHPVSALPELLPTADVVVLITPLTEETTGLVDARFLSQMRDGALLVNAARGPVVDTEALIAEVGTGRLHAALDVTDPEPLPEDSPLWAMPNVLVTPHVGGAVEGLLRSMYRVAGDQLRRYVAGEPLHNIVSDGY